MVRLECGAISVAERVGELLGLFGNVLAQGDAGEVEATRIDKSHIRV